MPLHAAARGGHAALIATLVGARADVDAKGAHGRSPLHWAAFNGEVKGS
jgi:ankyrin repeat protein